MGSRMVGLIVVFFPKFHRRFQHVIETLWKKYQHRAMMTGHGMIGSPFFSKRMRGPSCPTSLGATVGNQSLARVPFEVGFFLFCDMGQWYCKANRYELPDCIFTYFKFHPLLEGLSDKFLSVWGSTATSLPRFQCLSREVCRTQKWTLDFFFFYDMLMNREVSLSWGARVSSHFCTHLFSLTVERQPKGLGELSLVMLAFQVCKQNGSWESGDSQAFFR